MKYVEDTEMVCEDCKYRGYDREKKEWYCNNQESENYGLLIEYADGCEEWEDNQ